jgi:GLPGLI family protein
MKKILIVLCFISFNGFSQNFQGKAYYMSKVNVNMDWMKNLTPDRAAYMKGRMKSATEKNYTLEFDSNSSYFQEEVRLEPSGESGGFNWMQFVTGPAMGTIYRDIQSNTFTNKKELFGKIFLVRDTIPEIKWVMTGETKTIGIYNAYKATSTKEVEERVMNFSNRSRQNQSLNNPEEKRMKKVVMTAWFTPEIPVATGPQMFGGLPGLILEISADNLTMLCTKVVLNPKEKLKIKKPSKGKVVSSPEYEKIAADKAEEMRSRWDGRRSRGSGRAVQIRN